LARGDDYSLRREVGKRIWRFWRFWRIPGAIQAG
jgi:hypothetical protein